MTRGDDQMQYRKLTNVDQSPLGHLDMLHHLPISALDSPTKREDHFLGRLGDSAGDGREEAEGFSDDAVEVGEGRDGLTAWSALHSGLRD
jgi:hypothetical protein